MMTARLTAFCCILAQLWERWSVHGVMKKVFLLFLASSCFVFSQRGPRPGDLTASPQAVGDAGIVWYTTWDTALAEAKRSNRPIFFMAAAATCSGIPGVF